MAEISIRLIRSVDQVGWLELRLALWPHASREQHLAEISSLASDPARYGQFVACSSAGAPIGFAEVSVRSDYVNGTHSSPVAFLEGIYVVPDARRQGIAKSLVAEVERWAREAGCRELASDVLLDNELSQAAHIALGFEETERVVYFRKGIA
jgi:aminoglycoside 6'-N-acetyltransferase I